MYPAPTEPGPRPGLRRAVALRRRRRPGRRGRRSEWDVAANGDAVEHAMVFAVVAHAEVHRRPVVPDHDVTFLPPMPHDVLRCRRVAVEQVEQGGRLETREPDDPRGERGIDEEPLAPAHRMHPHDWMPHRLEHRESLTVPDASFRSVVEEGGELRPS